MCGVGAAIGSRSGKTNPLLLSPPPPPVFGGEATIDSPREHGLVSRPVGVRAPMSTTAAASTASALATNFDLLLLPSSPLVAAGPASTFPAETRGVATECALGDGLHGPMAPTKLLVSMAGGRTNVVLLTVPPTSVLLVLASRLALPRGASFSRRPGCGASGGDGVDEVWAG